MCKNDIPTLHPWGAWCYDGKEMKAALLSYGEVNRVRVAVVKSQTETSPLEKSKISGVNKLNNFQFEDEHVCTRWAHGVGDES